MNSIKLTLAKRSNGSMPSLFKILSHLQKNLIIWIPFSMVLGFTYGNIFDASILKTWIIPVTFLMVYPMMVTLNIKKLFAKGEIKLLSITQLINSLVIPAIGYGIGWLFFKDNIAVRIGFLLIALIPTSGMTITWTGIAKGNVAEAIRMTVAGLLIGAVLTPFYLKGMLATAIEIPATRIFTQIAVIVFIPLIFGFITQQLLIKKHGQEKFQKSIKIKFPPVSTLGVLLIVFIAMALKAKGIVANPAILLKLLGPLAILYVIMFAIATFVGRMYFAANDAIAMVFGVAMRNLSIALAIAMSVFGSMGSEIALVIALAFIIQVQSAVWYVKYAGILVKGKK